MHILYEHDPRDPGAFGSAQLRLLRPLTHPVNAALEATFGTDLPSDAPDIVVFDRLWRRGLTPDAATAAVAAVARGGARVVYAVDDNLLDLDPAAAGLEAEAPAVSAAFAEAADGVLVTTQPLAARYATLNPRVTVVPNVLDERLLVHRWPVEPDGIFGRRRLVIGYMGTPTHAADLRLVEDALRGVVAEVGCRVELIGGAPDAFASLGPSLVRRAPPPGHDEYPLFMRWWTTDVAWDIALAPLAASPFSACKSAVKALDYAAIAAPGIFSRLAPYEGAVAHGVTGLLADSDPESWRAALLRLAEDATLRGSLAQAARERLWREGVLAVDGGRLARALLALADRGDGT